MARSSLVLGASLLPMKIIPDNCKSLSILATNNRLSLIKVRKLAINHHPFGFRLPKNSFSVSPCRPIGRNCSSSLPMLSLDAVPSPTVVLPWLMLPPESSTVYKFYRPAERDVKEVVVEERDTPDADSRCLGSSFQGPWVAYIQPKDCQLFLFNPLSGKKINLPSVRTLPSVQATQVDDRTGLVLSYFDRFHPYPVTPQQFSKGIIKMVVLSSSPMDNDCIAVVPYGVLRKLAFCKIRDINDASRWVTLDSPLIQCNQIVFHSGKKLFFTLTRYSKELEAWDLHNDPIKRIPFHLQKEDWGGNGWPSLVVDEDELDTRSSYCWHDNYLVYDHQSQELFIVTRYTAANIDRDGHLITTNKIRDQFPYKTLFFDVFKVDFINDDHVELQPLKDNIGNRAFFIGSNPGFALSTTEFPELRPNSIYFTDDHSERKLYWGGYDLGIYDYEERSISSCYYPIDLYKTHRISPAPIWFTPESGC